MELNHTDDEGLLKHEPRAPRDNYRDKAFAQLFVANVALTVSIAVTMGLPNISSMYFTVHHEDTSSHGLKIFFVFLSTSFLGGLVSAAWLNVLQKFAGTIIAGSLKLSILGFFCIGLLAFADAGHGGRAIGLLNLLIAGSLALYYVSVRALVPFAASNLSMASKLLCKFPRLMYTAYLALGAQTLWVLIWSTAVIGVLAKSVESHRDSSSFGNVMFFGMLLSLLWTLHVIKNLVHCISAGVVGEWWFGLYDEGTVHRARLRALTTSLGSVCFGSLVVAVLNTLQMMLLTTRRRKSQSSVNACLECMVDMVQRYLQYLNKYAFCQVAIYGKGFRSAGHDTMTLFRDRGWSTLVNDSLISNVLSVGCLAVGGVCGLIGAAWIYFTVECTTSEWKAHPDQCESFNVVLLTFGASFSIGYAMCAVVSSVLDSIVATIFVCFAEDPAAMQRSHPAEYAQLVECWGRWKPELLVSPLRMDHA